jgi:hypothetical protein
MFYSMWHFAPKLFLAGGLKRGGTYYVFGVKDVVRATSFTLNTLSVPPHSRPSAGNNLGALNHTL